jgi:hypothetical protein
MSHGPERRVHARRATSIAVDVRAEELPDLAGDTRDFSAGGFFMRCGGPHQLGTLCDVEFHPAGRGEPPAVRFRAEVTRVVPEGIGFRFTSVDDEAVRIVQRFTEPPAAD